MDPEANRERWRRAFGVDDLETLDPATTFDSARASKSLPLGTLPLLEVSLSSDHQATEPGSTAPVQPEQAGPRYTLAEAVGRGGMGIVYRAIQTSLQREIAVKRVHPLKTDARLRAKFLSEARVTGFLEHPNIVPVYDLGRDDAGELLLAMKLVGGVDWKSLLHPKGEDAQQRAAKLGLLDHLQILSDVCNALAYAHTKGILHLDLKPANVMVGEFGEVLVMDWGIATAFGPDAPPHLPHSSSIHAPCGTPRYMAPELAEGVGAQVGPWTDIYLLGGILYEILLGEPPNKGATFYQILMASVQAPARSYPEHVPAGLQAICDRSLAKDPQARYGSVQAFRQDVQAWLRHHESSLIADRAAQRLTDCSARLQSEPGGAQRLSPEQSQRLYSDFAAAVNGFQQSLLLWQDNTLARDGERQARRDFARAALEHGDLVLARAQLAELPDDDPELPRLAAQVASKSRLRQRARSTARRLRWGLWSLAAALLLSLAVGLSQVNQARELAEEQRAEAELQKAEAEEQRAAALRSQGFAAQREQVARSALNTLIFKVDLRLRSTPGETGRQLREELLEAAFSGLDGLRAANVAEDSLSLSTAGAFAQLGDLRQTQGQAAEALRLYQAALDVYGPALAGAAPWMQRDHIVCLNKAGFLARQTGDLAGALEYSEAALALSRVWIAATPESSDARALLASSLSHLAMLEAARGGLERQVLLCREALELLREQQSHEPENLETRNQLLYVLQIQGQLDLEQGRPGAALACFEESYQLLRSLPESELSAPNSQRNLRVVPILIAEARTQLGDPSGAVQAYDEAVAFMRAQVRADPGNADARFDLATCLANIAQIQRLQAQFDKAQQSLAEAGQELARGAGLFPADLRWRHRLGDDWEDLSDVHTDVGDLTEAETCAVQGLAQHRELMLLEPDEIAFRVSTSKALYKLASIRHQQRRLEEAQSLVEESIVLRRELVALQPSSLDCRKDLSTALGNLGDILMTQDAVAQARQAYEEQLQIAQAVVADSPADQDLLQNLAISLGSIARVRRLAGDTQAARTALEESLATFLSIAAHEDANVEDQRNVAVALGFLADDQREAGELQAAIASYEEARSVQQSLFDAHPESIGIRISLATSLAHLGTLHQALSRPERALQIFAEAWQHFEAIATLPGQLQSLQAMAFVGQSSADIQFELGQLDDAISWSERAVAAASKLAEADPRAVTQLEQLEAYLRWLHRQRR